MDNKKHKIGIKQIAAIAGVVILVAMYVITLVAALMAKPYAHGLFLASIYCSLAIPVLIYGFMIVTKAFGRKEGEMSMRDYHKLKKEIKSMPKEDE